MSGPAAAGMLLIAHPTSAVVFHSADDSETALLDAIDAGGTAYLTKDATPEQIVEAVRRAARGEVLIEVTDAGFDSANEKRVSFSEREKQVVELLAQGLKEAQVEQRIGSLARQEQLDVERAREITPPGTLRDEHNALIQALHRLEARVDHPA